MAAPTRVGVGGARASPPRDQIEIAMADSIASKRIEGAAATILFGSILLYVGRMLDGEWLLFGTVVLAGGLLGASYRRLAAHACEILAFVVLLAGLVFLVIAFAGVEWGDMETSWGVFLFSTTSWLAARIARRWRGPAPHRPTPLAAFDDDANWERPGDGVP